MAGGGGGGGGAEPADGGFRVGRGKRRSRSHAPRARVPLRRQAAFGDAYGTLVRPAAPLRRRQTRARHAGRARASRARADGPPRSRAGAGPAALAHGERRAARAAAPLRLPAASAGAVAGAARAGGRRGRRGARRLRAARGRRREDGVPARGPGRAGGGGAARGVLRAHDAAIWRSPRRRRRRAAERAADEACDPRARSAAAYRVEPSGDPSECLGSNASGVTLLEARAHTRALRAQLAAMRLLCAPAGAHSVSGASTLRRALGALAAGARATRASGTCSGVWRRRRRRPRLRRRARGRAAPRSWTTRGTRSSSSASRRAGAPP